MSPENRRSWSYDNEGNYLEERNHKENPEEPPKNEAENQYANAGNNLFITGLAPKTNEKDLEMIFSKYGKLERISIMYDPHTMLSRGFAFVTFGNVQDAEAALEDCSRKLELHGKVLIVDRARRSRARTPTPGVYCGPPKRDTRRNIDYNNRDGGRPGYGGRPSRYGRYYNDRGYNDERGGYDYRRSYDDKRHHDSRRHYPERRYRDRGPGDSGYRDRGYRMYRRSPY